MLSSQTRDSREFSMDVWKIPRESKEWIGPIIVTVDDEPTENFEAVILPRGTRPTDFFAVEALSGGVGLLIGPGTPHVLLPGDNILWVKVTSLPEAPVMQVATIVVS